MASTELLSRPDRALADSRDLKWVAGALIIGAITFNAILCLINTNVTSINNSYVVGSEAAIITIALSACYRTIEPKYVLIITGLILYTAVLAFIRSNMSPEEGLNFKVSRDFLIPITFLLLGKGVNNIKLADYTVYVATAIILFFALFEYFSLDAFLRVFSVTEYYVARGTLDALDPSLQWASGLMVSGMRPSEQGRELLTFLGRSSRVVTVPRADRFRQFRMHCSPSGRLPDRGWRRSCAFGRLRRDLCSSFCRILALTPISSAWAS